MISEFIDLGFQGKINSFSLSCLSSEAKKNFWSEKNFVILKKENYYSSEEKFLTSKNELRDDGSMDN